MLFRSKEHKKDFENAVIRGNTHIISPFEKKLNKFIDANYTEVKILKEDSEEIDRVELKCNDLRLRDYLPFSYMIFTTLFNILKYLTICVSKEFSSQLVLLQKNTNCLHIPFEISFSEWNDIKIFLLNVIYSFRTVNIFEKFLNQNKKYLKEKY